MGNIKGIECSLYNGRIEELLHFLSNKPFDFYIQRCMKIDATQILPKLSNNFCISSHDLRRLSRESIWELVMYVYPIDSSDQTIEIDSSRKTIETYDDFIQSPCICCLIFYDCGLLDLYVKESNLREQLYDLLLSLEATDMELITDVSDSRTYMHL